MRYKVGDKLVRIFSRGKTPIAFLSYVEGGDTFLQEGAEVSSDEDTFETMFSNSYVTKSYGSAEGEFIDDGFIVLKRTHWMS